MVEVTGGISEHHQRTTGDWVAPLDSPLSFDQGTERSSLHYVTGFDGYQCGSSRTVSGSFSICPPSPPPTHTRGGRGSSFTGLKSALINHLTVQSCCKLGLRLNFMRLKELIFPRLVLNCRSERKRFTFRVL